MLADDLVAHLAPQSGCDISCILPIIRTAPKFILGPDISAVAETLAEDYKGLVRVFDRCRLPYPAIWLEVAQQDRPKFMAADLHIPTFQIRPKRVGFLLQATRADMSAWKTHLFWSHPDKGNCCSTLAIQFDMINEMPPAQPNPHKRAPRVQLYPKEPDAHPGWTNASESVRQTMLLHTRILVPDYGLPSEVGIPHDRLDEFYDVLWQLGRADWAGEATFLLSIIGLLNARNAIETKAVDLGKLNRARSKRRKPLLFEHKVLKIAHRQVKRMPGDSTQNHYAPMRGHFVRGHWKVRRSGIFFWTSHARGDFGRGFITKDYVVVE